MTRKHKILIIDDDDFMADILSMTLENIGFENVETCTNGFVALDRLATDHMIDIVLLDLNMPDLDGIDILHKLGTSSFEGSIALFSGESSDKFEAAIKVGSELQLDILGSLKKPASADDVSNLLGNYL